MYSTFLIRHSMAPSLRSRKIVDKSEKNDNLEQKSPSKDSPNQFDLDSSFNLPPPGPATQALIEQLAASETEIEGLDDIPENDLFNENNEISNPNPSGLPETDAPQANNPTESLTEKSPDPELQKTKKRGKRPKQDVDKQCPICPKTVKFFRQHMSKSHGWEGKPLKFMLSVYSTQKLKSNVFECADCLYRFTHRQRHLDKYPNHEIKKVTTEEKENYPKQVTDYMRFKGVLSERGSEVLNQYAEYCREKLKKPLASFQYDAISKIFRGTHSLRRTDLLGDCITKLKEEKNYTLSSARKFCFDLKLFITWMGSGHQKSYKISKQALDDAIKLWLKETSKECLKEQQKRKVERFTLIPSMEILCEAQDMVEKFIEERILLDSKWHSLTVHEKLSLLLFQIHSRANCRVGILLNFTTEDLGKYQPGTFIRSNDHKTGSIFTSYAYITQFEKNVLNELHEEYAEKMGMKPTSVFPGANDNNLTTQSATIAKLMKNLFNITAYKFHPNACRKVWETYYDKNKEKIPGTLQKIFESNSGHSGKTRDKHYVAPPSDTDLQQLFEATDDIRKQFREKRKNPEFCSAINREMPEYEIENAVETPNIVSEAPPEPPCEPSSSKSQKIFDAKTSTPVRSKKRTKNSTESDDDSEQASVDTRAEKDSIYKPPRHLKVERIPSGNKKTRAQTEELFDNFAKKMMKFPKSTDFALEKQFKHACGVVASKRVKLSKSNIRDIVGNMNLNEQDANVIFKKVYAKTNHLYSVFKI